MMKIMMRLNRILTKYKLSLLLTVLFILGSYHLLMTLIKLNAFNLNEESILKTKFILIRFYHFSYSMLIGLGISYKWSKSINWIWLYLVFRIIYTFSRLIPVVDKTVSNTLIDGLSFGLLIIIILILSVKKSK